jgi:hypothetical protein
MDFIVKLNNPVGYYLPPDKFITFEFIKGVLAGKKKLMLIKELKSIGFVPPKMVEFNVKDLYPIMKEKIRNFSRYFPDSAKDGFDKGYFFTILNALDPNTLDKLMAQASRKGVSEKDAEKAKVVVGKKALELIRAKTSTLFSTGKNIGKFLANNDKRTKGVKTAVEKREENFLGRRKDMMKLLEVDGSLERKLRPTGGKRAKHKPGDIVEGDPNRMMDERDTEKFGTLDEEDIPQNN